MDYGAKADGVTDDTTAVLKAMKAAVAAGGVVYCPAGTYKIAGQLTIPDGVSIYGDGMTASWLEGNIVFGSHSTFSDLKMGASGSTYGTLGASMPPTPPSRTATSSAARQETLGGQRVFVLNQLMQSRANTHITLEGCRIAGGLAHT